ncbi:MAG: response regulator [Deltaproteobacteria bacterium]|nr:response regulator [Deltaproteobacteria bacterium]
MDEKPRILGVDDSLTIRKALEIVLKPAGYMLDLAADGTEAIEKAKATKPALILLDFILPDMRGTEVCRRLAEDPDTANIPVILISAKGAEIRQAYEDIGNVVSYIAKPFKPQIVINLVAEVLAKAAGGELVKTAPVPEAAIFPAARPALEPIAVPPAVIIPELPAAAPSLAATMPLLEVPPLNGGSAAREPQPLAARLEEIDEAEAEEAAEVAVTTLNDGARRELLEVMFETLRAGLEGVYVEEVDTPAGAAADQARSYTDLIESLTHELGESLQHARSGARHTLYGDGSVRSLDDTLLDVFRRACRLLFRAVVVGAVEADLAPVRQRVLIACHRDSAVHEQLRALALAHPEWQIFTITEGFRQLPMMTRLYGPTHLIAEVTGAGALWDQLRQLQRMPEARSLTVIGLANPSRASGNGHDDPQARSAALAERGITKVLECAFDLERELSAAPPPNVPVMAAADFAEVQPVA